MEETGLQKVLRLQEKEIKTDVNFLVTLCFGLATDAQWHKKPREVGTDLMLIVSEVAEAMEGARKDLYDDKITHRKMLEVELADAIIRIFDTAGKYGLDLGGAFVEKLAFNQARPDHKLENREKEGGKQF